MKKGITLAIVVSLMLVVVLAGTVLAEREPVTISFQGESNQEEAYQLLEKVNSERKQYNIAPLQWSDELEKAAIQRCAEIAVYFDHERPDGSSYKTVGTNIDEENILAGIENIDRVHIKLTDSNLQKSNILNEEYSSFAAACFVTENGQYCWVELFSKAKTAPVRIGKFDQAMTATVKVDNDNLVPWLTVGELDRNQKVLRKDIEYAVNARFVNKNFIHAQTVPDTMEIVSSDPAVAEVKDGKIIGHSAGEAVITLTLSGNSEIKDQVKIKVIDNPLTQ